MAGVFGYEYGPVAQGWTPWALGLSPNENPNYNYMNATSLYDPSRDTIDHTWGGDALHGPVHSRSRDIVMRWFNDDRNAWERQNGRKADDATLQQLFLTNLARLHRDFDANKWDWNQSGFAGFDQYLTARPGGAPGTATSGTAPGRQAGYAENAGQGPAGSSPRNQGASSPQSVVTNQPAGAQAAGGGGGGGTGYNAALADQLSSNPDFAYQYALRQLGIDPTAPSRYGAYLKKKFQPLMQADLAARSLNDQGQGGDAQYLQNIAGDVSGFMKRLFAGNGDFYGEERALANQALGNKGALDYLGTIQDQGDVEQYLNQLETLRFAGSNPMIQQSIADALQRQQEQYDWETAQQLIGGTSLGDPYLEWLRKNPRYNKYIGVQF